MKEHTNVKIELIENFPCNSKNELEAREGYYIRLHKNELLNKVIPGRKYHEYVDDNKDKIQEQQRQHYVNNNKDKIREQQRQYRLAKKRKF